MGPRALGKCGLYPLPPQKKLSEKKKVGELVHL
jgi:hypothetical protein